jgi:hypothetical protein
MHMYACICMRVAHAYICYAAHAAIYLAASYYYILLYYYISHTTILLYI